AGKRLDKDHAYAEVARLHGRVRARRSFAIVVVANYDCRNASGFVGTLRSGHRTILTGDLVLDAVGLVVKIVDGAGKRVVGNVVEVTPEPKPGAGHRNMVCSTLPFCLDEELHAEKVF